LTEAFALPRLLTVEDVARRLSVSTKSIRRWIKRGDLVTHRFNRNVRVDASSVMRLLATPANAVAGDAAMKTDGVSPPRLLRRRGRAREWTGLANGEEIGLGTTDDRQAVEALAVVAAEKGEAENRRRPWRVYRDDRRGGFAIMYYDGEGRRRYHRIPGDVQTLADAEQHAALWYAEHIGRSRVAIGHAPANGVSRSLTFEQFGTLWTSGKLAKLFPDHVRSKVTASGDESRFRLYVYPIIGSFCVIDFDGPRGLELVERVLQRLPVPPALSRSSRRQVMQAIHRLLTLAVYPARLIAAHPLPRGFLPKPTKARAKAYLYPSEDQRLLACLEVPVLHRLFYGILIREGLRVGEALSLTWRDLDLERGVLFLPRNKTDEARSWALDPGVTAALLRWKERVGSVRDDAPVLRCEGARIDRFEAARSLREHLRTAGVTRPQLFESDEASICLRAHDLRASFITVNLALGKSEAWITDRTGHRSSQMIYTYKRAARTFADLNLGGFVPLSEAIPDL
jgi:excisionase family DNA binding protein